jgi:hypothetical protein
MESTTFFMMTLSCLYAVDVRILHFYVFLSFAVLLSHMLQVYGHASQISVSYMVACFVLSVLL